LLKDLFEQKDDDVAIEKLMGAGNVEPVLASLSSSLNRLPRDTVEERLCQIEMAKKTYTAYNMLLTMRFRKESSLKNCAVTRMFELLVHLPLPDDTAACIFKQLVDLYPECARGEAND